MTATPGELLDLVDRVTRAQRMAIVDDLGEPCTLWLAAAPLWTRSAAETTGFPVRGRTVTDFVQQARAAGWCKTRGSLRADGPTELRFWMPDEVRRDVLDTIRVRTGGDMRTVQSRAREVAISVVRHAEEAKPPGALLAWAKLCVEAEPDDFPGRLLDRVRDAVGADDLGGAQELVNAGKALNAVVEGTADSQLTRARLMLDGGLERRRDEQALSQYLDRRELSAAVFRLLQADARTWALHLRGVGGMGKSMLIRYLRSGQFAEQQGLPPIPMACVDFDHVSPEYPVRRPVQLLLELADELAPHAAASDQAYRALRAFYDRADMAHQAAGRQRGGSPRPLDDELVRAAVGAFARVIDKLGGVLLILDTCEELAKWNPGNLNSPAILATLEMVESLHEQAGSVRVLLAGRRPLPARGWLEELAVPGFTVEEARQYLADVRLPAALTEEIIRQSRAIDGPVPAPGQLPAWVSPFDLALYRAWANEEPGLSVADIAQGNDAYIESRIIQRLDDKLVRRSLPMLAAGGKCRVETIAAALGCDATGLGHGLAAQEWIKAEDGSPPTFATAWPTMAERLRRYYDAPDHQAEFSHAIRWFAQATRRRLDDPRAPVDVDEVIAALHWAEPAEAAGLWDLITARAARPPGQWNTVGAITIRTLGLWEGEGEWPTTDALRAAILAAHIAAHRGTMPLADRRELWGQVLASAGGHPDPARRRQLRALGALETLPYDPDAASLWDILRAERGSLMSSPEVGAAAIDVMHCLLEAGRADAAGRLRELLDLDSFRAFQGRPGAGLGPAPSAADRLVAWALVAGARLLADSDPPAARDLLADAERLASAATGPEWAWPHWDAPEDLLARVRIERGLIDTELIPVPSDLTVLDRWEGYAASRLGSVDGERLASLCLRLRLRHRAADAARAERWEAAARNLPGHAATNSAHDLVPPLFVAVAEAWLSAGQPERGLALLRRKRSEAITGQDDAAVRHADAGIVRLARRLRLADQRSLLSRLTNPAETRPVPGEGIATLDEARRAWAVIYREPPPDAHLTAGRLAGWHTWWQCQAVTTADRVPALPWSPGSPDADLADLADIEADLKERRLLTWRDLEQTRTEINDVLNRHRQASGYALSPARSGDPYRDLRPELRWSALDQLRYQTSSRAPIRLIAEMAFDEAELLALRLPAAAAQVFWEAADAYAKGEDHLGRLIALVAFHDALAGRPEGELRSLAAALAVGSARFPAILLEAWRAVEVSLPGVAAVLAGAPGDAGAWRFWAEALQRHLEDPAAALQAGRVPVGASIAPFAVPAAEPEPARPARGAAPVTLIRRALCLVVALPLAALLAGRIRTALRLAAERGIGAARLETLTFEAAIGEAVSGQGEASSGQETGSGQTPAGSGQAAAAEPSSGGSGHTVRLGVRLLPWRAAPVGAWSRWRLRALDPTLRLLRRGRPRRPTGYSGSLESGAGTIGWTPPLDSPPDSWWECREQVPVPGTIRTSRSRAGQPWERILAASLGPAAAGRIEWVRLAADEVLAADSGGRGTELMVAQAEGPLAAAAAPGIRGPRVRYVTGRAVRTSMGPCMNLSGELRPGRGMALRTAEDLARRQPMVVVLQAEAAGREAAGAVGHDDLEDKMQLAMALLEDGVPAVLILPVLPAGLIREVRRLVTAFAEADGRSGPQIRATLVRPVRAAIARGAGPAVLDDVIVFLNGRYA